MAEADVCVVIPTLGRPSLARAIASALQQDVPVHVVVVNDSGRPLEVGLPEAVTTLDTSGRRGAAHARNLGMAATRAPFVAFLDDDDVWLDGHLRHALDALAARPDRGVYSCRGLVIRGGGRTRIEPVELLGERTVADYFYGHDTWRSRARRILTPTLVFRRELAQVPMDESLTMSEDTWWLLTLEATRGARMVQGDHVGVVVHSDDERERGTAPGRSRDEIAWAHRLESVAPGAGAAHLAARQARTAARAGDPGALVDLARHAVRMPGGWRWLPPLGVQGAGAVAISAWRRLRGRR